MPNARNHIASLSAHILRKILDRHMVQFTFSAISGFSTAAAGSASIFTGSAGAITGSVAGDIAKYELRKIFLKDR